MKPRLTLVTAVLILSTAAMMPAATSTFQGSGSDYATGGNWTDGVPDTGGGDTAIINAAAIFNPGGDFAVHAGGLLQINAGGSWSQPTGGSWMQLAGGSLTVNGGAFNQGAAGAIIKDAATVVTVNSGTASFTGNYEMSNSTLILSGGVTTIGSSLVYDTGSLSLGAGAVLNIASEFKPVQNFTLSGGTLTANIISLADGPGSLFLAAGSISLNWAGVGNGIYPGTGSVDFSLNSTGSLFFSGATIATLNSTDMLTGGRVRYNGAIDYGAFTLTEADGGVYVESISTVPEPSVYAVAIIGLCIVICICRRKVLALAN